jgi:lipopolysaccharide transport system ATP-binding protein
MISVENVSKKYIGFSNLIERVLSVVSLGLFKGTSQYIALNKLNFNAESGQIIGVIGRNGAGKSTLLKILSGVSMVDSGNIIISGVIRPMLELGVGFNPELTGLENVRFNGLLWGYTSDEIHKFEKEIFHFAGLVGLENQILKNYSTGMTMRLGFSLATANRPDILLIDEALAVGDASFQVKCLDRFKKFIEQGSIIIVVSHDLQMMSAICQKIILLDYQKIETNIVRGPEPLTQKLTNGGSSRSEAET